MLHPHYLSDSFPFPSDKLFGGSKLEVSEGSHEAMHMQLRPRSKISYALEAPAARSLSSTDAQPKCLAGATGINASRRHDVRRRNALDFMAARYTLIVQANASSTKAILSFLLALPRPFRYRS